MGDRALVVFHDRNKREFSPVVYLHWRGGHVLEYLKGSLRYLRDGDCGYSCARFIGYCHTQISGNLSLGVFNAPSDNVWATLTSYDFSPGDAGVVLVDVSTWVVSAYNGYIADQLKAESESPLTASVGFFELDKAMVGL